MHALLLSVGSTGDVLPFCALGRRLRARGHDVTVAANTHFAPTIARAGLDYAPLGDGADYVALTRTRAFVDRGAGFKLIMEYAARLIAPALELIRARRASVIAAHPLAFGARLAEERDGARALTLLPSPAILESANSWLKRFIIDRVVPAPMNAFARFGDHRVVGLFPRWYAEPTRDWPRNVALTHFPLPDDDDGARHDDADEFFATPPIVFTAGTGMRRADKFFAAAADAAARLGVRAALLTPHAEQVPSTLPDGVRRFSYLPLSRFLPRASALVHHGGIGSAAVALAAGVPQLVVPFAHDQPDNAARLERLGVAASLAPSRLSGARLADALARLVGAAATAARCRELAARVRAGDGLGEATLWIERHAGESPRAVEGAA